jgi:hypothetical protein
MAMPCTGPVEVQSFADEATPVVAGRAAVASAVPIRGEEARVSQRSVRQHRGLTETRCRRSLDRILAVAFRVL